MFQHVKNIILAIIAILLIIVLSLIVIAIVVFILMIKKIQDMVTNYIKKLPVDKSLVNISPPVLTVNVPSINITPSNPY